MVWCPRATVAVVVPHQGKFLFVEEISQDQKVINQPAGHIEEGESIQAAALRETLEETGWQVALTHFLGLYTLKLPKWNLTYHRHCFIGLPHEQITKDLDKDILATHWLSPEEIVSGTYRLRSPLVSKCVEDYVSGKRYPLDIIRES